MDTKFIPNMGVYSLVVIKAGNLSEVLDILVKQQGEQQSTFMHTISSSIRELTTILENLTKTVNSLLIVDANNPLYSLKAHLESMQVDGQSIIDVLNRHLGELASISDIATAKRIIENLRKEAESLASLFELKKEEIQGAVSAQSSAEGKSALDALISLVNDYYRKISVLNSMLNLISVSPEFSGSTGTSGERSPSGRRLRYRFERLPSGGRIGPTQQTTTQQSTTGQTTSQQPTAGQAEPQQSTTAQEATEQSATGQAATEQSATGQEASQQSAEESKEAAEEEVPAAQEEEKGQSPQEEEEGQPSQEEEKAHLSVENIMERLQQRAKYLVYVNDLLDKAEEFYNKYIANLFSSDRNKKGHEYLAELFLGLSNWLNEGKVREVINNLITAYNTLRSQKGAGGGDTEENPIQPIPVDKKDAGIDELIPPAFFENLLLLFSDELTKVSNYVKNREDLSGWDKVRILSYIVSLDNMIVGLLPKARMGDKIYNLIKILTVEGRTKLEDVLKLANSPILQIVSRTSLLGGLSEAILREWLVTSLNAVLSSTSKTVNETSEAIKKIKEEEGISRGKVKLTLLTPADLKALYGRKPDAGLKPLGEKEDALAVVNAYAKALRNLLNLLVTPVYEEFLTELNSKINLITSTEGRRKLYPAVAESIKKMVAQTVGASVGDYRELLPNLARLLRTKLHEYIPTFINLLEDIIKAPVSEELPEDSILRQFASYMLSPDLYLLNFLAQKVAEYGKGLVEAPPFTGRIPPSTGASRRVGDISSILYQKSGQAADLTYLPDQITLKRVL